MLRANAQRSYEDKVHQSCACTSYSILHQRASFLHLGFVLEIYPRHVITDLRVEAGNVRFLLGASQQREGPGVRRLEAAFVKFSILAPRCHAGRLSYARKYRSQIMFQSAPPAWSVWLVSLRHYPDSCCRPGLLGRHSRHINSFAGRALVRSTEKLHSFRRPGGRLVVCDVS